MAGDKKNKIAVIGGGIQGLSAAYFLSKDENNLVTVFECQNSLGGLLGLLEVNKTPLEGAYHHFFNHDVDIIALAKELGLEDKLLYRESKMGLLYDGVIYPFSTPFDLLRFYPLNFLSRLRVGLCITYLRFFKDCKRFENITASCWLKKYMGQRAYAVVWEPLLKGKFGDLKDGITMAWMWGRLSGRAKTRNKAGGKEILVYPRGGFKQLVDVMVQKILTSGCFVKTGVSVSRIRRGLNENVVLCADGVEEVFDKVIVTTPINVFLKLTEGLPDDYTNKVGQIKYRAAHVTVMVLNRSLMPAGYYWLNINDRKIPLLAVLEHTNMVPKEDYGGKTIIYLGNYPDPYDPIMSMDKKEIKDLYCKYLPVINKSFKPGWLDEFFLFKDNAAQPVVDMNYKDSIPAFETPIKNLFLLTMAQIYPADRGVSNAVKQARDFVNFLKS